MAEIKLAMVCAEAPNMLNRLPRHTPTLPVILAEIGNPPLRDVARTFGVTVATIKNWIKHGAPQPVLFSLWWLTRWGMHNLNAEVFNLAQLDRQSAQAQARENAMLRAQIDRLLKLGNFGAANDPLERTAPLFGLDAARLCQGPPRPSTRPSTKTRDRLRSFSPNANPLIRA